MLSRAGKIKRNCLLSRWSRWEIRQCDAVHGFPVIGRNHFNCIPRATVQECAVRTFASALLTADAEVGVYFDTSEWRMVLVGNPEHAGFDRTIFDACRRARTPGAAVGSDCKYSRSFFARRFTVALRHWPMLFYNVVHTLRLSGRFTKVGGPV